MAKGQREFTHWASANDIATAVMFLVTGSLYLLLGILVSRLQSTHRLNSKDLRAGVCIIAVCVATFWVRGIMNAIFAHDDSFSDKFADGPNNFFYYTSMEVLPTLGVLWLMRPPLPALAGTPGSSMTFGGGLEMDVAEDFGPNFD
mmetsp:Transcript_30399/g.71411  ORF Transcript_30399/g.71411 Transcript_30399/m.71411 type:complete len:145 (+) Transcript_30399:565-999(+)